MKKVEATWDQTWDSLLRAATLMDMFGFSSRTLTAGDALLSPAITKRVIKAFARMPRPGPPKAFDELSDRNVPFSD
jgi:hypothetical protein